MDYNGTDLKYAFSAEGAFNFDTMDWDMVFIVGNKSLCNKESVVADRLDLKIIIKADYLVHLVHIIAVRILQKCLIQFSCLTGRT